VKQLALDAQPFAVDEAVVPAGPVGTFFRAASTVVELELRKLRHDSSELLTRAIQPFLWLVLFGQVFTRVRGIPTGHLRYIDFMAPGVLAQSVLFVAIFYGIQAILEKDQGVIVKFLVSPVPRSALVFGKSLSAGVRGLSQCAIIYVLTAILHVRLNLNPLAILGVCVAVVLGAALFSTFSLIIACLVKTQQRVMGIGQIITMPLFFASNAIYPIHIMPPWLQVVSHLNPLTYEVDALRTLMLRGVTSPYGVGVDLLVLTVVTGVLIAIGGKLYPQIVS
jgi:ABC-2 type transport system permease protein